MGGRIRYIVTVHSQRVGFGNRVQQYIVYSYCSVDGVNTCDRSIYKTFAS